MYFQMIWNTIRVTSGYTASVLPAIAGLQVANAQVRNTSLHIHRNVSMFNVSIVVVSCCDIIIVDSCHLVFFNTIAPSQPIAHFHDQSVVRVWTDQSDSRALWDRYLHSMGQAKKACCEERT